MPGFTIRKKASAKNASNSTHEWNTNTLLTKLEFQKITSYFSNGNNGVDNLSRAQFLDMPPGVTIAPGTNIRLGDASYMGNGVHIGPFCYLNGDISIDDDCTIGPQCCMTSNTHHFNPILHSFKHLNSNKPIHIKRGTWVCAGVTIVSGVTIGECNLICAGAVVTKDTPNYSIIAGIPGKKVGNIDPQTGEYSWF